MAETADTTAPTETVDDGATTPNDEEQTETVDLTAEVEKWKELSRKNEERAKANAEAARRLQEIEDASKSEQEKLADALNAAQAEATTTKAELARMRAAVKFGLSEDDLELLGDGDPEAIEQRAEKLAARLAASTASQAAKPVSGLGKTTDHQDRDPSATQLERDLRQVLGI